MAERRGGRGGRDVVRAAIDAMRRGLPVDKGDRHRMPQLPQIRNPVLAAAIGAGAVAGAAALRMARPTRRRGRDERFQALLARAVAATPALRGRGVAAVAVDVHEAFGKPALVNFDVTLDAGELARVGARSPLLADLLERGAQAMWENPELAPVAVRGRLLAGDAGDPEGEKSQGARRRGRARARTRRGAHDERHAGAGAREVLNLVDVGFTDEIARPEDLFERYGAPPSDPGWRP